MDKEIAEKIFKALNEEHIIEDDISEVIYKLSSISSRAERIKRIRFEMNDMFLRINWLVDYIEEDALDILEVLEGHFLK